MGSKVHFGMLEFSNRFILDSCGRPISFLDIDCMYNSASGLLEVCLGPVKDSYSVHTLKRAVMRDLRVPVIVGFCVRHVSSVFDYEKTFDERLAFWYRESHLLEGNTILVFESVAKGKELMVFNGTVQNKRGPLFWASLFR